MQLNYKAISRKKQQLFNNINWLSIMRHWWPGLNSAFGAALEEPVKLSPISGISLSYGCGGVPVARIVVHRSTTDNAQRPSRGHSDYYNKHQF